MKKKKSVPVPRRDTLTSKTYEVFGENRRFISSFAIGPHFTGYQQSAAWENRVQKYTPKEWKAIGNIKRCFHGTDITSIAWIAIQSLQPGGRRNYWHNGLFGKGIYVAPQATKAWNYTKPHIYNGRTYRYLLEGRVALGRTFYANKEGNQQANLIENNCHSVVAEAGKPIDGLWKNILAYTEYVVYDPVQVVIDFVYEYQKDGIEKTKSLWVPLRLRQKNLPRLPSLHPCKRQGKRCKNSFHESGCIVLKKKKGVKFGDVDDCPYFEY